MHGKPRSHLHGVKGGRPKGHPEHPNSRAARLEGRRRWVERMREAKAAGQIQRFPGGRRAKGLPPLSDDPKVRRAQRLLEAQMAKKQSEPPWDASLGLGEKLVRAASVSLDRAYEMLCRPVAEGDIKREQLIANLALGIIGHQVRVDTAVLTQPRVPGEGGDLDEQRQRAIDSIREAFLEATGEEMPPGRLQYEPGAHPKEPVIDAVVEAEPPASEPSPPAASSSLGIADRDERVGGRPRDYARSGPLEADRSVARLQPRYRPPKPVGTDWGA